MSNDGEITVEVSAEGTDEAADQLAGEGGDGDGGGGAATGGEDGGLTESIRGGIIGGIIATGLGGLIDILSPLLEIVDAFLAPIAAIVLRSLQPVLAFLLNRVLPVFLSFMTDYDSLLATALENPTAFLAGILAGIQTAIKSRIADLKQGIRNKIDSVITRIQQLPGQLKSRLAEVIPNGPSRASLPSVGGDGAVGTAVDVATTPAQIVVDIAGGVPAFIDEVTRSRRTDG